MEIQRIDNTKGDPPAEWPEHFQGYAKIQQIAAELPNATAVFAVHFDAGGRSRPHVHAAGQILHITSGRGLVGDRSGRRVVEPGDVVSTAPGEWHWHGAAPDSPMTHLTVQATGRDSIDWDVDEGDWASDYDAPEA